MPFKPTSLPDQIAAARSESKQSTRTPITPFSSGGAQRAKVAAINWARSNVRDPMNDSAPPWFSGDQPFSQLRFDNEVNFSDWKGRFLGETATGYDFAPPPPEPAPMDSFNSEGVA